MKKLKQLFHFLGGIHFAIILIALAAATVVVGTLLESQTNSHLFAVQWTYGHPLFSLLLCLFFINILFSALRRWPFKKRHIPFLITHFGLLMIISGTILKNRWGLQGNLTVWEGSGNQQVLMPHSYALWIEEKNTSFKIDQLLALDSFHRKVYYPSLLPQFKCKVMGHVSHVKETLETWIKESKAYILGLPVFDVYPWTTQKPLPEGILARLPSDPSQYWRILAIRTQQVQSALERLYLKDLVLQIGSKDQSQNRIELPLEQALQNPIPFAEGLLSTSLELPASFLEEENHPALHFHWKSSKEDYQENFTISLQGQESLYVQASPKNWCECPFSVDLVRSHPILCLIEDEKVETTLLAFDPYGRVHGERFSTSRLQTLISYDQGFGGYTIQAKLPIPTFPTGRQHKELADAYALKKQLQQAMINHPPLAPPLHLLEQACLQAQVDFTTTLIQFLEEWKQTKGFLFYPTQSLPPSLELALQFIDWKEMSPADQQGMQWVNKLLNQLENSFESGEDPLSILKHYHWPFLTELEQSIQQGSAPLNLLAQQIFSLSSHLPPLDIPQSFSLNEKAQILSAYFRVYQLDYRSLYPAKEKTAEQFDLLENYWKDHPNDEKMTIQSTISLETPLTSHIFPDSAPLKIEDQRPGIILEVEQGALKQKLALAYDNSGVGLKWPVLNGNYVVRFQPMLQELPHRIRLRQARQIPYPQSTQIYSYECDLLISENGQEPIEKTLSMNHVYETWDGYRFYLAGIGTSVDQSLKRIQLVINHDPAKYRLTYPGAILVFLGIVLLFWLRPYRKKPIN